VKVGQHSGGNTFLTYAAWRRDHRHKTWLDLLCQLSKKTTRRGARPPRDHRLISRRLDTHQTHFWKTLEAQTAQVT